MHSRSSRSMRPPATRTGVRLVDDISTVVQRQLGLLTREQAVGVGMTRSMVEQRVASGIWVIRHPGVYAIAGTPMSWNHKVMAAVLAAGGDALASHLTGAALYRLDEIARTRIAVTVDGTTALRLRGMVVHRSLVLAPQDRSSIDGLPEPVSQHPVRCGPKQFFIDAACPDIRLALEYHGFDAHRTRSAFDGDAKRTRHLVAVGWRVLTFTSKDTDADIVQSVRAFGV